MRAMYLFSAVADLVQETGDEELFRVCETLWDSTVNRRMYITGGLGSQAHGEGLPLTMIFPAAGRTLKLAQPSGCSSGDNACCSWIPTGSMRM